MLARNTLFAMSAVALLISSPALAQQKDTGNATTSENEEEKATAASVIRSALSTAPEITIQHLRPQDQRGMNMFETPKEPGVAYDGFKLDWGAAFTQQFQGLSHENNAGPRPDVNDVNQNQLVELGSGFNNATANLYLNAQLAPGIRVALTTYLSSRHHNETWVKDGYLLIDQSPIALPILETLMDYVTVKAGHFEINYGDAHFRRSDNGQAIFNPFVGNLIMDAFTTQIGGEVYLRSRGFMAMGGVTGGEIRGQTTRPDDRSPAYLMKLGYDGQVTEDLRVRLTGSHIRQRSAANNTLYAGDRAGSRYYNVLENTASSESANFSSGLINPGFRDKVSATMFNPFVKFHGLELFGVIEQASGRAHNETEQRDVEQYAIDAIYRFLPDERLYVGGRYNTVNAELQGIAGDVNVDRTALAAGWFITPNLLLKGEYVRQQYNDFPTLDIRSGGKFDGFVMEGVVSF